MTGIDHASSANTASANQLVRDLVKRSFLGGDADLAERRRSFEHLAEAMLPLASGIVITPLSHEALKGEWVRSTTSTKGAVMLYFHGGGYIMGSPQTHRHLVGNIVVAGGLDALVLDYPLAPEHPFPSAVQAAKSAYLYLISLGFSPARIVIAGDSAGGGLAVALMLALKETGEALPGTAALISPWLDLTMSSDSYRRNASSDVMTSPEGGRRAVRAYLGGSSSARNPMASPFYGELTGLPRLLLLAGKAECFHDEIVAFADKARSSGVAVELLEATDMFHIWPYFAKYLPEGRDAVDAIGHFIRASLKSAEVAIST